MNTADMGMIAECDVAESLGVAPRGLRDRVSALLRRLGLPVCYTQPGLDLQRAIAFMSSDKKNRHSMIHCALPSALGRMHRGQDWTAPVEPAHLEAALVKLRG